MPATTATLAGVASTAVEVRTAVALDRPQSGSGTYVSVLGRQVGSAGDYRLKLRFLPGGRVAAGLV